MTKQERIEKRQEIKLNNLEERKQCAKDLDNFGTYHKAQARLEELDQEWFMQKENRKEDKVYLIISVLVGIAIGGYNGRNWK